MQVDTTVLVHRSADDLFRYFSDPRHVLVGVPRPLDIVATAEAEPNLRRYEAVSRLASGDRWEIVVNPVVPGRRLTVRFGRKGKPSSGWFEYELDPQDGATVVRTTGEVRMSPVLAAINAYLGRLGRVPKGERDLVLEAKVTGWLADSQVDDALTRDRRG